MEPSLNGIAASRQASAFWLRRWAGYLIFLIFYQVEQEGCNTNHPAAAIAKPKPPNIRKVMKLRRNLFQLSHSGIRF